MDKIQIKVHMLTRINDLRYILLTNIKETSSQPIELDSTSPSEKPAMNNL